LKLYHLYGLAVASEFDCPELSEITSAQAAARGVDTVRLIRAQAPLALPAGRRVNGWMQATNDACLYRFGTIARMLVQGPDQISVEMLPEALESDMRAYLYGTGFGTLVHMRGLIPLHVSAIRTPEGVIAFTGPSGAGKSTRVAELHFRHGWPIICDDVAVLHPDDEQPLLHAGMNRIKLWRDAVERLGIDPSRLTRDLRRHDKFHLHAPEMFVDAPCALNELIAIGSGIEKGGDLQGADAFTLCMRAIYRPEAASVFSNRAKLFSAVSRISERVQARAE